MTIVLRQSLPNRLARLRVDRPIAITRAILALTTLTAIWLDPTQPVALIEFTFWAVAAYTGCAITLAVVAQRFRGWALLPSLGTAAHVVDIGLFTALLYLTEGPTSPFFVLLNFSMLSALLSWGWRGALWTTATLVAMYLVCALVFWKLPPDQEFEIGRFIMRLAHLVTMGGILVFFGIHQQRFSDEALRLAHWPSKPPSAGLPAHEALEYLATVFCAPRALLLIDDPLEPWVHATEWQADRTLRDERLPPGLAPTPLVPDELAGSVFALSRGTALAQRSGDVFEEQHDVALGEALHRQYGVDTALCLPLQTDDLDAWLVVPLRREATAEDFLVATIAIPRIAVVFQRAAALAALREATAAEERLRLGRDLHDGVLQALAGAVLKLEAALREQPPPPELLRTHIDQVCDLLAAEQRELRGFITRLRPQLRPPRPRSSSSRNSNRWPIPCVGNGASR